MRKEKKSGFPLKPKKEEKRKEPKKGMERQNPTDRQSRENRFMLQTQRAQRMRRKKHRGSLRPRHNANDDVTSRRTTLRHSITHTYLRWWAVQPPKKILRMELLNLGICQPMLQKILGRKTIILPILMTSLTVCWTFLELLYCEGTCVGDVQPQRCVGRELGHQG